MEKQDFLDTIYKELEKQKSESNAAFVKKLTPGCNETLGVKVPALRKIAKGIAKEDYKTYIDYGREQYLEDLMLKAFVVGYAKDDVETILCYAKEFVPKIDNWMVNDAFCQTFTIARKSRKVVFEWLQELSKCEDEFSQRVVAVILMSHFLVDDYIDDVLLMMEQLKCPKYYTKMGVAWTIATAYAKFPIETMVYLKNNTLDDWTYNKAIQKMRESYRVSDEDKKILNAMKRK